MGTGRHVLQSQGRALKDQSSLLYISESRKKVAASLSEDVRRIVIEAGRASENTIFNKRCPVMMVPSRSESEGVM